MRARASRLVLVLAGASTVLLLAGWGEDAHAICVADPMDGTWENVDDQTRGITRVEYSQVCHDVIRCPNGRCEPVPEHVAVVRVFGQCHPRDCAWGQAKVYRHAGGDWKYAVYEVAGRKRTVWLRLESDGRLTVVDEVRYRGDRPDRETWNTLRKAS